MIKFKFFNALTIALILFQAVLPIPALAMGNNAPQQDYAPGSVVTISGDSNDGFVANENVHVDVSGPNSFTASCDEMTDDNGAWSCDVPQNAPTSSPPSAASTAVSTILPDIGVPPKTFSHGWTRIKHGSEADRRQKRKAAALRGFFIRV